MRALPLKMAVIAIFFFLLLELIVLTGVFKNVSDFKNIKRRMYLYSALSILSYTPFFLYLIPDFIPSLKSFTPIIYLNTLLFSIITSKLILAIFTLVSLIFRLFKRIQVAIRIWNSALFISIIILIYFITGITIAKQDVNYKNVLIESESIPTELNGLKVIHFTDFHAGTFFNKQEWLKSIQENVNKENADFILFTGDFVNNFSNELEEYKPFFSKLKSKYGKFSILGNHDYGDYSKWDADHLKQQDHDRLIAFQDSIGFELLLNESRKIEIKGMNVGILGVENWGNPPFPRYGDLNKAINNTNSNDLNILLTHDPNHWKAEVVNKSNVFLSLSGHTHGMQWGINLGGYIFSFSALLFPNWGGLYKEKDQYLYVNVGLGEVGFPGRLDMRPEISIITIKRKN